VLGQIPLFLIWASSCCSTWMTRRITLHSNWTI
jgi:hypothetical protein